MAVVVSSLTFVKVSTGGTPVTEGYFLIEYRAAGYRPGGEFVDLSPYFRNIQMAITQPVSGALMHVARPNGADFPSGTTPVSARFELHYMASSIVTINMSGIGIRVASGTLLTTSGIAGVQSGFAVIGTLFSGLITANTSGDVAVGVVFSEIVSGVAVSGTRFYAHVIGY